MLFNKIKLGVGILILTSLHGVFTLLALPNSGSAIAQTVSCGGVRSVNFSGKAAPEGVNIRAGAGTNSAPIGQLTRNQTYNFDGYTFGEMVRDRWTNQPDYRWYKLVGQNAYVASAAIQGNAPGSTALPPSSCTSTAPTPSNGQPNFNANEYRGGNPFWNNGFAPVSTNPRNPKLGNALGNCTWYANGRAKQFGRSAARVDRMLGNAGQWGSEASAAGITTSSQPQVGAIAQWNASGAMPYGHVAVVEQVNSNGTVLISESSYGNSSWNFLYRTRTISANNPSRYILP
jgi:surface antigen